MASLSTPTTEATAREVAQSYTPSRVVAIFLVQFDVKSGYQLVWSRTSVPDFDFSGLEFKVLPSGIHELEKTTILVSHYSGSKLYYGLGRFRQYVVDESDDVNNNNSSTKTTNSNKSVDRKNVRMYSLGVVCDPKTRSDKSAWKPNEFISNGWEYIDVLDNTLVSFLEAQKYDDLKPFEQLYDRIVAQTPVGASHLAVPLTPSSSGASLNVISPNVNYHLLTTLPTLLKTLGPLLFVIYKQSLLRKRILFFNKHQHTSDANSIEKDGYKDNEDDENNNEIHDDKFFTYNAFDYLISLISIIPQDIETISKDEKSNYYSQPIYNIGLNDLSTNDLIKVKGYVGTTNDEILMYQNDVYDVGILLDENVTVFAREDVADSAVDSNKRIRATQKDYSKFKLIYKPLSSCTDKKNGIFFTNHTNMSTDDLNSIYTAESATTADVFTDTTSVDNPEEPNWWLQYATEPVSWRESIWSAFAWFASAGQVESDNTANASANITNLHKTNLDLFELIAIVGYFHKLTKKWFYLINEVITEELADHSQQQSTFRGIHEDDSRYNREDEMDDSLLSSLTSSTKINVELTYQDIIDMELDPYSKADLQFVKEFVLLYWGSVVDHVEIGIGFTSICC
ncbi:uncharacterized protein RJT20DRAFT_7830 [Scheffersomyces xylosifermentans]|uniref:uncharacterized protein n=1 Tax=Scheffersomyces xylosifermentans TaxID=1304137 RepID=UPI00315CA074